MDPNFRTADHGPIPSGGDPNEKNRRMYREQIAAAKDDQARLIARFNDYVATLPIEYNQARINAKAQLDAELGKVQMLIDRSQTALSNMG